MNEVAKRGSQRRGWTAVKMFSDIYLSSTSTEEWQTDSDPPGEVHSFCDADGIQAGLWRPLAGVTPDPVSWVLPAREIVLVLEGEGRIEVDGQTVELHPGTMMSLPQGARTVWHLTPDFKELWILAS